MKNIKSINELFGLGGTIRSIKNRGEVDANEIYFYIKNKKIKNLTICDKDGPVKRSKIKYFNFDADRISVRVEKVSYFKIDSKGTTDYNIYINDKIIECSRKISRIIFKMLVEVDDHDIKYH